MNNRWKMNRIGFVNFWLYDEEDFEFEDGKLLLRGQNGSGKSITTQSFIPFVLDGDRTPSRLDPFGSSDRRMEYYFLGEEGRDEATGYLYLEFKKEESDEYRTIGIGQRAKRGKPMDFWGFLLLDGSRIGTDLHLYKEIGSSRIPLDKREVKAVLGEENLFTDSQSEYKKLVNQHIFGFRKAEQYEQFIRLLVKVRAPKLSKEFKPTKVYEILNDSLQTLTDEDLRAMVDAMEKMDEIQDSLEMLNRAFDDVKIIRNEYTRYNQYMLAKKAQAYMAKRQEVSGMQQQLEKQEQEIKETKERQKESTDRLNALEERKQLAETERNGLLDLDLEEIDRKLDYAKTQRDEAAQKEARWESKIQEYKERIWEAEQQLREIEDRLEQKRQEQQEQQEELLEQQEILQWEQHEAAMRSIGEATGFARDEIGKELDALRRQLEECRRAIAQYEAMSAAYDEVLSELEQCRKESARKEQELEQAQEAVNLSIDQWIVTLFETEKSAKWWHPKQEVLKKAEQMIQEYRSVEDAGAIQELLRDDYDVQRVLLLDKKAVKEQEWKTEKKRLEETGEELLRILNHPELEPERDPQTEQTRRILQEMGITAVPFYKTVEFSAKLDDADCVRLEAQLQRAGILDALVVSAADFGVIRRKYPEFQDTVLSAWKKGSSAFDGLQISEALDPALKEMVGCILSNLYKEENGNGIYLGTDGWFRQGMLVGRAEKSGEAEFIGTLARARRKEQKIHELEELQRELEASVQGAEEEIAEITGALAMLLEEYRKIPGFSGINGALELERQCIFAAEMARTLRDQKETQEREAGERKNQKYQVMLKKCTPFPYGRTEKAYEEALDAAGEYRRIWQEIRQNVLQMATEQNNAALKRDAMERDEQQLDDAFVEKRGYTTKRKECEIQIRQYEDYLSRPDIAEKANRLKELREELKQIERDTASLREGLAVFADRLNRLEREEPKRKEELQRKIETETNLRTYFEEELSLKLVLDREGRSLPECAKMAAGFLRESDKNRESGELLNSLLQVYQKHNGSLINYGTSVENCFEAAQPDGEEGGSALRSRVRVVSVWNGKKVYLEEFYKILKAAIDETELLIQKKDRELFEDILSQTISQQLTDRIAESRKWVTDMSNLMKAMDTSMGLSFSLDWKPHKAENDSELDTAELEQILLRDRSLLSMEDIERVAAHFRSRIRMEKMKVEEGNGIINYMELVRDALDYRKWFEFHMYFQRREEPKKLLTNAAFNRFSGGEKAMAMYVPLFAAVNAQYKKAERKDHPRMVALDEAFAGVDDKNISSMFELVEKLDFDYIMNSQALWGCFDTVRGLRIAELLRPQNSKTVTVIRYTWNGRERVLDAQ